MIGEDGAQPVMFQQGGAVHRAALAGSGVPAADPPRRDGQDVDAAEQATLDIGATRLDGVEARTGLVYADRSRQTRCLVWTP